ncbi:MAG TPA: ABC transporter permease [Candidatus Saccharimonadales bacterium]|nr:ABC transporter permease [Candidatus Saccharimonadales bacterium]
MNILRDTWTMTKRSLRHTVRSMDTIITVVATPIAMMLMFVYVFGSSFQQSIGTEQYINFIAPTIIIMTVVSGIAYAAVRLSMDLQKGIINRFKTMPVAPSSILGGHALSSTLSNLFSSLLVLLVAMLIGFRSDAGLAEWGLFAGLLVLFTAATTWLAILFGLFAKTMEGAGAFSYILLLLVFLSSGFTPVDSMHPALRWFAENQPMTPIIETMRSLLTNGTVGASAGVAIGWSLALLVVSYVLALRVYKTKTI